jgi:hypothetical protein
MKKIILKKSKSSLIIFSFMVFSLGFLNAGTPLQANNEPMIIVDNWKLKVETAGHIELSTRIVKCSLTSPYQVHILFFNENPTAKSLTFTAKITNNADGNNFSKTITINADLAAMYIPNCDNSNSLLNSLKIDLPSNYNPADLTITITY